MFRFLSEAWRNRVLVARLARREIEARFRGSFLGVFWAVIVPLVMLAIYTLVFGSVLGSRWTKPAESSVHQTYSYPLILFAGLIIFGIFGETVNRAPGLVMENVAYVKKVVFPLEVLPFVALASSLATGLISFGVFLVVFVFLYGPPPPTILLLPFVLFPLILVTLGLVYLLASLGVFLRDLRHIVPPFTTMLLFVSPVFYAPEAMPEKYRWLLYLNPLTTAINHARDVIFWGKLPDLREWAAFLLVSLAIAVAGAYWFQRTEKAFADVV